MYDWIPFFKEIARKAIKNKESIESITKLILGEDHSLLRWSIDPFTFIYFVASRNSEKNFEELKLILELESIVPEDRIFPTPQGNSNRGFHHSGNYLPLTENSMWDFFELSITEPRGNTISAYFNNALKIGNVGITKLTQALFLINPEYFIPIDDRTAILFPDKPTKQLKKNIENDGFAGYLELMDELKTRFLGCQFWEMNRLAYAIVGEELKLDFDNLWNQISSQWDGDKQGDYIDDWYTESQIAIGYTDNRDFEHFKSLERGRIIIIKKGMGNFHGLAVLIGDDITSIPGARPVTRDVIWLLKDKSVEIASFTRATIRQTQKDEVYDQIAEKYPEIWRFLELFENNHEKNDIREGESTMNSTPKNLILYGPPGTGKTYITRKKALDIVEPGNTWSDEEQKERFEELLAQKRISFVTFHQSFGYEEFVEGIRPVITENSNGNLSYEIRSGIFKELCERAKTDTSTSGNLRDDWRSRGIWKMSLGDTSKSEESGFFDFCVENICVFLGYGKPVDYSQCHTKEEVKNLYDSENEGETNSAHISILNTIKNEMEVGDLVLVSYGNRTLRGLAEITGNYKFKEGNPGDNIQTRAVKWLWSGQNDDEYIFWDELLNKKISQRGLYNIEPNVKKDKLEELFNSETDPEPKNYVLIIDEINRGNVARIFGELITLIEEDKRIGGENSLSVHLPYSGNKFSIPSNLYIIGTMNTADRSLVALDTALRRRFEFEEMRPQPELLADLEVSGITVSTLLEKMNQKIEELLDRDHSIGHAYFWNLRSDPQINTLKKIFRNKILPQLQEHFFDNPDAIKEIFDTTDLTNEQWKEILGERFREYWSE